MIHHFETCCGAYAHFKLTRYLLRITKNPQYGDSMERVMYNTVLGALPLNKLGKAFYHSNYHHHARKEYFDGYKNSMKDEWPCCPGTLPQVAADYHVSTYLRDSDGIFVNLYIPSTLRWDQNGSRIALTQSGSYPLADNIAFEITTSRPTRFAVRLRIPRWAQSAAIRVNGDKISDPVCSGTFAAVCREWKSGDRIQLELPKTFELKPVDAQRPDLVALTYGPLVLFALKRRHPEGDARTAPGRKATGHGKSRVARRGDGRILAIRTVLDGQGRNLLHLPGCLGVVRLDYAQPGPAIASFAASRSSSLIAALGPCCEGAAKTHKEHSCTLVPAL